MKKKIVLVLVVCVLVSVFAFTACAATPRILHGTPVPTGWEIIFEDYDIIFIMSRSRWDASRNEYVRFGLYYNTYPLTNIYYVDEYFWPDTLFFSSDGTYFAHVPRGFGGFEWQHGQVVGFFANGILMRSYCICYLSSNTRGEICTLPSSCGRWINRDTIIHDQQANTLSFTIIAGNNITFDMTTGDIIRRTLPLRRIIDPAILLAVIAIIVWRKLKARKRRAN